MAHSTIPHLIFLLSLLVSVELDQAFQRQIRQGPGRRHPSRVPALACESAEEMGKKLTRRFDRRYQRQGIVRRGPGPTAETGCLDDHQGLRAKGHTVPRDTVLQDNCP